MTDRNCAHCKFSKATVNGGGLYVMIEFRCTKKDDFLVYQVQADRLRDKKDVPSCPVGLFKRED